jgi:hypothetical protein
MSYQEESSSTRQCPLGHPLHTPKTIILAAGIVAEKAGILLERKFVLNRELWCLPHTEIKSDEQPEVSISRTLQSDLLRIVSVESLIFANGDEQYFHVFYELKLLKPSGKSQEKHAPAPYGWFSWQDIPWDKFAYRIHKDVLLKWLTLNKDEATGKSITNLVSQYRGIKIL